MIYTSIILSYLSNLLKYNSVGMTHQPTKGSVLLKKDVS